MSSLKAAVRIAIQRGWIKEGRKNGVQSRLAKMYGVTRQRVSQIAVQERKRA